MLQQSGVSTNKIYQGDFLKVAVLNHSTKGSTLQSILFIVFYQWRASINEILKQFGVSTNEIYQENTCARNFFKYSHMAEGVSVIKKRLRQRCFPVNIANFLRHLSILKIICEQLLLKVKLNLFKVCKLSSVWLKFISKLFSKQLFKRLFLKVQHFQTQLKRGCFFVILQKSCIFGRLLYEQELFMFH